MIFMEIHVGGGSVIVKGNTFVKTPGFCLRLHKFSFYFTQGLVKAFNVEQ